MGAGLFRTRDKTSERGGEEKRESVAASTQIKKKAVADHSSVRGQIKERQGWRRGHRFILSFFIYPFSPRKITSHFDVGERRLRLSLSTPARCKSAARSARTQPLPSKTA